MKALMINSPGNASIVNDAAKPTLRPDYILIKPVAVALNPSDWKHIAFVNSRCLSGCDYAGIVEEVGPEVTKSFKKGDRIAGCAHGGNVVQPEDGAFAEYIVAKGDVQIKIPDNISFEEASTLGIGISTVGQTMYQALGLPSPENPVKEKQWILIYGGSTATGALAIQFAKLSGFEVVTTCSKNNFEFVKSLGADVAYDYKTPNCGAEIREYTKNDLFYAVDNIADENAAQICADALSSLSASPSTGKAPTVVTINMVAPPRKDIVMKYTLMYTIFGERFNIAGFDSPVNLEDFEFAKDFWEMSRRLLEQGKLKTHRVELRPGGLDGILSGLDDLKNGRVSGVKLVYRLS